MPDLKVIFFTIFEETINFRQKIATNGAKEEKTSIACSVYKPG